MKFLTYNPEQAYLLPPSVPEVLGENPVGFFLHRVVERLEWSAFERGYVEQGHPAYHPASLLKVWLYAYALGVSSARRLEQRVREDLAFRYLAGGATPDFWTLHQFRTRHARALNDLFTQVVEFARSLMTLGTKIELSHRLFSHAETVQHNRGFSPCGNCHHACKRLRRTTHLRR